MSSLKTKMFPRKNPTSRKIRKMKFPKIQMKISTLISKARKKFLQPQDYQKFLSLPKKQFKKQTPETTVEKSTTTTSTTVKTTTKSESKIIEPEIVKPEIIEPNDNEFGLIVATSDLENENSEKRGHKDVAIEFSKSGIDWEKICNSRERYKNNELRRVCEVFRSVVTEKPDFEVNRIERSSPAIPVGAPEPGQAIKG